MSLEIKSGTHMGFPKSGGKAQKTECERHSKAKARGFNLLVSNGEETH